MNVFLFLFYFNLQFLLFKIICFHLIVHSLWTHIYVVLKHIFRSNVPQTLILMLFLKIKTLKFDGEFERKKSLWKLMNCLKTTSKDIWTPIFCCSSYFSIKMSSFNTLKILILFISSNNRVLLKTFFSAFTFKK